jgi:hypothetical protein
MNSFKVGQVRTKRGGVEKKDMESKDDTMPSPSKIVYQVLVCKGVSQGARGQEIEGFAKWQEIEGFVEWQKMLSVLGEESSKVETSLSSLLKCKDVVCQNMASMT